MEAKESLLQALPIDGVGHSAVSEGQMKTPGVSRLVLECERVESVGIVCVDVGLVGACRALGRELELANTLF